MKTCENCGHQKVCEFFNDWPNCPNWEPQLVHCGECKGWNDEEWARENCPWKDGNIIQTADAFAVVEKGNKIKMNIFNMTKEDFGKVPERGGWSRDIGRFDSLVIIPQDYPHDSGWMCMDFVAVSKEGEPICKLSGCSDVLNLDGIGGYGNWRVGELPSHIEPKGWSIDCLPCGYLRLFSRSAMTAGPALSNFTVYAE